MLKTYEALIAIMTIVITFIIAYRGVSLPDIETVNWKYYGFSALQTLDNNGLLANFTIDNNTAALNNSLFPIMFKGASYDTTICSYICNKPNISASKIVSAFYYTAGNLTNFAPRKTILYMWSG